MTKDNSKSGSASVRLRRKRDEKEERARERRSVEYRESRESLGENLDTLDHNTENTTEVRNNLRRALRSKYKVQEDPVTIKHFGYIDQPQPSIEDFGPVSLPGLSSLHNQHPSSRGRGGLTLMRGVMWIHRDRVFSRWKERYIVVTRDYLQCYKRVTTEASQMGPFLNQIRLSDVSGVSLADRKGYLTLLLSLDKEDNLVLRRAENIRDWHDLILRLVTEARAKIMQNAESFWKRPPVEESERDWLVTRRAPSSGDRGHHPDLQERPPSVASVDRRHRHRHRHRRHRAKSHTPGDVMSQVSHVSHVSVCQSATNLRSVSVDSGNYSLQTASTERDRQQAAEAAEF